MKFIGDKMCDRFKFRGKRVDNGEFIIGFYSCLYSIHNHTIEDEYGYVYQVIPKTIGQCTGIKDCNKVLIFEADTFEKGGNVFKIEWYDGGFIIQGKDDFQVLNESNVKYYEIVITGNIHKDNK